MKLTRNTTKYIHFIIDQLIPPLLRDQGWFMKPFLRLVLKDTYQYFVTFKEFAHELSEDEFREYYEKTYGILDRSTDLNQECLDYLIKKVGSGDILEAGCGNGYLSGQLVSNERKITACDINVTEKTKSTHPTIVFVKSSLEALPFEDGQFDEVVCTHTLEHVRDLPKALAELRRVTKRRLTIVVPRQRPYRYTFDLHLHFFPYEFSLRQAFMPPAKAKVHIENLAGDWLYTEDSFEGLS